MAEELLTSEAERKGTGNAKQGTATAKTVRFLSERLNRGNVFAYSQEDFNLPRRIFCPMRTTGPVSACEYQFVDEGLADLTERLKEMLDIDVAVGDLDAAQEVPAEIGERSVPTG